MHNKICKYCGALKPLSEFDKNSTYKDGHINKCKECRSEYDKEYHKKNKEKLNNKSRIYYLLNKDILNEKNKKRYIKNRGKILDNAALYRDSHREELKKYFKNRYHSNKEAILESQKEYISKHREEKNEYLREYYKRNKDKISAQNLARRKAREKIDPVFKLKRRMNTFIRDSFTRKGGGKTDFTEKILGCSRAEFANHLKNTWENRYGCKWIGQPCHIDHIVPLATAKTETDVVKLCHYTNLQLLTPKDNMQKGVLPQDTWALQNNLIEETK